MDKWIIQKNGQKKSRYIYLKKQKLSMNFRVSLISFLIKINENLIFYPKLKQSYLELFGKEKLETVIDVGVNKGQSIKFFKKLNNKVKIIGFEPNRILFELLINRKINNCDIYNLGCSNINGNLQFNENILSESSSFEKVNNQSYWLKKKEKVLGISNSRMITNKYEVPVIRLTDFLSKNYKHVKIDILKIDVEGHEYNVLMGLFPLKNQINYIQLEEHYDDLYYDKKEEIHELLKINGYERERKIKHGFGEIYDVIYKYKK